MSHGRQTVGEGNRQVRPRSGERGYRTRQTVGGIPTKRNAGSSGDCETFYHTAK